MLYQQDIQHKDTTKKIRIWFLHHQTSYISQNWTQQLFISLILLTFASTLYWGFHQRSLSFKQWFAPIISKSQYLMELFVLLQILDLNSWVFTDFLKVIAKVSWTISFSFNSLSQLFWDHQHKWIYFFRATKRGWRSLYLATKSILLPSRPLLWLHLFQPSLSNLRICSLKNLRSRKVPHLELSFSDSQVESHLEFLILLLMALFLRS